MKISKSSNIKIDGIDIISGLFGISPNDLEYFVFKYNDKKRFEHSDCKFEEFWLPIQIMMISVSMIIDDNQEWEAFFKLGKSSYKGKHNPYNEFSDFNITDKYNITDVLTRIQLYFSYNRKDIEKLYIICDKAKLNNPKKVWDIWNDNMFKFKKDLILKI